MNTFLYLNYIFVRLTYAINRDASGWVHKKIHVLKLPLEHRTLRYCLKMRFCASDPVSGKSLGRVNASLAYRVQAAQQNGKFMVLDNLTDRSV